MAFGEEPPAELPGVCWARVPQEGLSRRVFRKGESSGSCRLSLRAGAAAGRAAGFGAAPTPAALCSNVGSREMLLRLASIRGVLCQPPSPANVKK